MSKTGAFTCQNCGGFTQNGSYCPYCEMKNENLVKTFQKATMFTAYFTFGQDHAHSINGQTFDKDCVVKITAEDPRATMFDTFGRKWAMQYDDLPNMDLYPRGVIELT